MSTSRRQFLGVVAAGPQILRAQATGPKRNVLFIAMDDQNDWIGCMGGYPKVQTPNLDRLAASGVLFTNAHCAAPLCNPSRAALMTGIRPSTSGIYDNSQPMRKSPVLNDAITLPEHMRGHGYTTLGGGKIYHGGFPDPQSWDDYFPSQRRNKPADPMPEGRPLSGLPPGNFDFGPVDVPDSEMGDYKVASWASAELQKRHEKPFFLACGIFRPHLPWYVPRKYFQMYPLSGITLPKVNERDLDDVPPMGRKFARPQGDHANILKQDKWLEAVQAYLASITFADAQVGRVLRALENSPHAASTTVVLWSDHGWHLGEKLHWRKFTLWEEATRNVLMVSSPGLTKPGGRCSRSASLLDVYPTLVDVCGLSPRKELEGASLMPLLKAPSARWDRPAVTTYFRENHSIRSERWRYTRYSDATEELYDHQTDPLEWTNLAGKNEHAAVKKELARWLPKVNAPDSVHEKGVAG